MLCNVAPTPSTLPPISPAPGGWLFLDNLHLMSDWAPKLERKLEEAAERAHKVGWGGFCRLECMHTHGAGKLACAQVDACAARLLHALCFPCHAS